MKKSLQQRSKANWRMWEFLEKLLPIRARAECTAIGTLHLWSAKDHLAQMTFCLQQNLIQMVTAIQVQQEVPPHEMSGDQMNARVFAHHHLRPWEGVYAAFEHMYSDLIQLAQRQSLADLMDSHRFSAITEGHSL